MSEGATGASSFSLTTIFIEVGSTTYGQLTPEAVMVYSPTLVAFTKNNAVSGKCVKTLKKNLESGSNVIYVEEDDSCTVHEPPMMPLGTLSSRRLYARDICVVDIGMFS